MSLNKNQIIVVGITGFVVIILILIFTGLVPGLKKGKEGAQAVTATLNFWGISDEEESYRNAVGSFRQTYPGVTVNYRRFNNLEDYAAAILDALAAGKGPDIFMIPNNTLPIHINKIVPLPQSKLSLGDFRGFFPQVVEQDFAPEGTIYALPLSIDTLALIYNRDMLDQAAVTIPETWEDFVNIVPKLVKIDSTKKITRAAAAIGASKNIDKSSHLLSLLMLQSGTQMVSDDFRGATFASKEGAEALNFYVQFGDASHAFYTWNSSLPNSLDAFSQGLVAMIFNYHSSIAAIKSRSPFINLAAAPVPQPKDSAKPIAYSNYFGYTVARQSKNPTIAWDFVLNLVTKEENAKAYLNSTGRPPALRSLINQTINDINYGTFSRQALIARSWPQIDSGAIDQIFSDMIDLVTSNRGTTDNALRQARDRVTQLMSRRAF